MLSDCYKESKSLSRARNGKIKIDLIFTTEEGGHFAAGNQYFLLTHCILSAVFTFFYYPFLKKFLKEMKKSVDDTNYVFLVIHTSMALKVISFIFEIIDLFVFKSTGQGFEFLNFLGQSSSYISQYLICCILVFVGHGWTLYIDDIDDFEFFLPISILIGIFKIVIIGVGRVSENDLEFNHRYDSFVGILLAAFQIAIFIYFIIGVNESVKIMKKKEKKMVEFLKNWRFFGSVYFMTFPLILALSLFVRDHSRNYFVEVLRMVSEGICCYYVAWVTTSDKGVYKNVANFKLELPGVF